MGWPNTWGLCRATKDTTRFEAAPAGQTAVTTRCHGLTTETPLTVGQARRRGRRRGSAPRPKAPARLGTPASTRSVVDDPTRQTAKGTSASQTVSHPSSFCRPQGLTMPRSRSCTNAPGRIRAICRDSRSALTTPEIVTGWGLDYGHTFGPGRPSDHCAPARGPP